MTATTTTLADFLLARIAEDEKWARGDFAWNDKVPGWALDLSPAASLRIEAECERDRQIVALQTAPYPQGHAPDTAILRALALPYADHPDYREEWRP